MKRDKNSMLYWYPKIRNLDIPQPKTEIYNIPEKIIKELVMENMKNLNIDEVFKVAYKIGYPMFIRTDQTSAKHSWKMSAYVHDKTKLYSCIYETISFNLLADLFGLPFKAIVFREYIPMDNLFTAFYGEMPVNPEIRVFIENGKVKCWHWYWIEDAIEKPSNKNWKQIIKRTKEGFQKCEIDLIMKYAKQVANVFKEDGYWSVDFCRAKDGRWILIDMALGEQSWHPDCKDKKHNTKDGEKS